MNKFFTLLVSAALSLSLLNANATTVTITPAGSNYDVTVDNITLNNLTAVKQGDVNVIAVNDANVSMILRFTDVNTLVADGSLNGIGFHYATASATTFASQFQIPNGDFETWTSATTEPKNWHGFKSASGSLASMAKGTLVSDNSVRPGSTGSKSALIGSGSVLGIVNNGTMTNGCLYALSTTPDNTWNHSEMDQASTDTDLNGDRFYTALNAAPDAINAWIKFSQGTANAEFPYATLSAIAFNGDYYQDPEPKAGDSYTSGLFNTHTYSDADAANVASRVSAKAQNQEISVCDWTEMIIPFNYDKYAGNNAAANAILITVSTNATPGKGSSGDKVWIDDMALIYIAGITNITATGLNGFTFDPATHNYEISYEGAPITLSADNFTVTADGKAAIVVKNVTDLGGGNYRIALGAVSADMVNSSLYTITVTRQPDDIWVMGDVNGNNWAANVGAKMTYNAETNEYTITLTTNNRYYSYFSFTKRLGENADDWATIAPYRFGAKNVAEGGNFVMREMYLGEEIELAADGWINAFQLPAGEFTLTIKNLDGDRKLIIDSESWPDPELLVYGSFNAWSSYDECIVMTPVSDGVYTTDYVSVDNGDGYSYFKFIKRHAGEEFLNIGAVSDGDFLVTTSCLNTPLSITAENGQAYKIPVGEYTLTADLNYMTLVIGSDDIGVEGDVTGDGTTDIDDVNAVINIILKVKTQDDYPGASDLNNDGAVDVDDMNLVINIILTSN